MEIELVKLWDANKHLLKKWLTENHPNNYKHLVEKLFELVINDTDVDNYTNYDISNMTVIDDGEYQGTQIFIIPQKTYQPSRKDYLITDTCYGSCSGCDTLQAIRGYDVDKPTENQVNEYMTLALHLIQKMKPL